MGNKGKETDKTNKLKKNILLETSGLRKSCLHHMFQKGGQKIKQEQ